MHDATPPQTDQSTVRLLHYSDLESAYDDPERVGALAARLRDRRDDAALVVGTGDNTALGVLALLTDEGRAQARPFFDAVDPAADTFGNHDLDFGREWVTEWAETVPPTYCCANLAGPGADRVPDGTVIERGGSRVGLVGLAHPETADICGSVDALRFTDPVAAARDAFDALEPVDYRVVLSHCGAHDEEIAAALDVDAILGGHLHDRHVERIDGTLLVRTAGGGTEFSEVALDDDPTVIFREVPSGSEGTPVDDAVAATYRERRDALGVDEVLARVDGSLRRTEDERFGGESRLGNFAADAFRAAAAADRDSDAGIGLFPAGALRTGPALSGAVTRGDVVSCCPFDGAVMTVALDGSELREVLAEAAYPHPGDRGWVQFHVSGLRVVWTDANEVSSVAVGGEPLDPDRTYRVATAEYVVVVDDWGPIDRDAVVAEHVPQWRALVEHARDGGLAEATLDGRIERVAAEAETTADR